MLVGRTKLRDGSRGRCRAGRLPAVRWWEWVLVAIVVFLVVVAIYDLTQRRRAILRVFPIVGHLRFLLEAVGPELRQYIVTDNDHERPFSRDQRRWIYSAAKHQNTYFGFGTDNDLEHTPGYMIVKQSTFPLREPRAGDPDYDERHALPCAKVLGGPRGRTHAFRMRSVINLSSMSYGSLSSAAVEALNAGARIDGCLQGSGEGCVTKYHEQGGDLIWQIGTGYYGCRDEAGDFSLPRFLETLGRHDKIRGVEIKLSQGAKPGLGGVLPGEKVNKEIAEIRGVPVGVDCVSPSTHRAFHDADSLLDFVELLASETGLPVGIKSAVGDDGFFRDLAHLMADGTRGVDWITIDGGEGGTGAAPLAFSDHVALPFKIGFSRVYGIFAEAGTTDRLVFIGSGRLGLPQRALFAFALGADGVNVGREAMLSIGCIQAQRCHTGRCPTGVTTNSPWRMRGLDPELKSVQVANYLEQLRKEILELTRACGQPHPALVSPEHFEFVDDNYGARGLGPVFGYQPGWGTPGADDVAAIRELMARGGRVPADPAAPA